MHYNDGEIMGNIGFGTDPFSSYPSVFHVDPYLPIENEPMGKLYSPDNFNGSDNKSSQYQYNPLTYKSSDKSYLDSWDSINEYFDNNPTKCTHKAPFEINKSLLILFVFIFIIIIMFTQHRQITNLQKMIEILLTNNKG